MDLIAVKAGRCKAVGQYWNEEEAKLIFHFGEDHNVVRARGVEYFIEKGKYIRNEWKVLQAVEGWNGVIEPMPEEQMEENKSDDLRADEAKLIINFGENKDEVMKIGVQGFIDSGKYTRNERGVLVLATEETTVTAENSTTESKTAKDLVALEDMSIEELQAIYVEKTGKQLAPAYKNNKEWIISKL